MGIGWESVWEPAREPHLLAVLAVVVHGEALGGALALVVAGPLADGVHVAPVLLGLRAGWGEAGRGQQRSSIGMQAACAREPPLLLLPGQARLRLGVLQPQTAELEGMGTHIRATHPRGPNPTGTNTPAPTWDP